MRKCYLSLMMFCAFQAAAQSTYKSSQKSWEAGLMLGLCNYSGDLSEKTITLSETHLSLGANLRYSFSDHFSLRAHLFSASISGDDAHAKDPQTKQRSFRFGSDILEVGLGGEWYFLGKSRTSDIGVPRFFVAPYVYAGIGGTFCGAEVEYYGPPKDRDLFFVVPMPEVEPRQRFLIAPVGAGCRIELNDRLAIGGEAGVRPVFSDKLDGVRFNGNPDKNDWYFICGATLSYILSKPEKQL